MASSAVSLIGLIGVLKSKPTYVRFYRDSCIADLVFTVFFTVVGAYFSFQQNVRTAVCEELSKQPELLRDMVEMGLSLENCELWFERAVMASVVIVMVIVVCRLHLLLVVSRYYTSLIRYQPHGGHSHSPSNVSDSHYLRRIYLLAPTSSSYSPDSKPDGANDDVVYAPVSLSSLSPEVARDLRATSAWISQAPSDGQTQSAHRHRHTMGTSGRISLPVSQDEGLLPSYQNVESKPLVEV